jgi:hypothetical protein
MTCIIRACIEQSRKQLHEHINVHIRVAVFELHVATLQFTRPLLRLNIFVYQHGRIAPQKNSGGEIVVHIS